MQLAYVFLGYFLGSMLFGYRITWLLKGVDIRKLAEDENPGTYNAFVFGGFWCGILTLLADMGKGYLPVILYRQNYSTGADLCSCDGGTGVWTCLLNFSRKKRWKGNCSFFWGTAGVVFNLETGAFAGVFLYLIFGGF